MDREETVHSQTDYLYHLQYAEQSQNFMHCQYNNKRAGGGCSDHKMAE